MNISRIFAIMAASALAVQAASGVFMPIPENNVKLSLEENVKVAWQYLDSDGEPINDINNVFYSQESFIVRFSFLENFEMQAGLSQQAIESESESDSFEDEDDNERISGFNRPMVGLKYGFPEMGIATQLQVLLPFGSEDIVGSDPVTITRISALTDNVFGIFRLRGEISYVWIPEDDNKYDVGNTLALDFYPGLQFSKAFTLQVGLSESFKSKNAYKGDDISYSNASASVLLPGFIWNIGSVVQLEFATPFVVLGTNTLRYAGADLSVAVQF